MREKTAFQLRKGRLALVAMMAATVAVGAATPLSFALVHSQEQARKTTDPPAMARGKFGQDLFMAIDHRDMGAVKALLQKGADPNSKNGLEFTPIALAAASHQPDVMKELISAGAEIDVESPYGTPLLFAAATAHLDGVNMLLAKGANPNISRNDGMTALMAAANAGFPPVVEELLKRKVDVNAIDANDTSALLYAARQGNDPVVGMLLGAGAKLEQADAEGITPLMAAAMNGRTGSVAQLLKAGANVNAKNPKGENALLLAAKYGDFPGIVKQLLAAGSANKAEAAAIVAKRGYTRSAGILGKPKTAPTPVKTAARAIPDSLEAMQKSMLEFSRNTNCVSCHQEGLGRMALGEAKDRGFKLNADVQTAQIQKLQGALMATKPLHEGALKDPEVMKQVPLIEMNEVTSGYTWLLNGLISMKDKVDPAAAGAMTDVLARQQSPQGPWTFSMPRIPMQSSFFTFTALAVRALNSYATDKADTATRVAKARQWMLGAPAKTSEDRAMRLLGLSWAGVPMKDRKQAVEEILKDQRPDGGWSQAPTMESDSYATGQALYALSQAGGIATDSKVYKAGLSFLLRTQDDDGTWFVNKRAVAANNYFDGGFVHGQSQYASFNGTSWALMALLQTVKK